MTSFRFNPLVPALSDSRIHEGKVRDTYSIKGRDDLLLLVASDRVSTHNIIHETLIPGKGAVLTRISVFWQERLAPMKSHLVAHSQSVYDFLPGSSRLYPDDLHERAMVVKKLDMIPVEFIFRSRMEGSLLKAYQKGEDPYGLSLPAGYQKMSQVGHDNTIPLFTPTDKSEDDLPLLANDVVKKYRLAHELALAVYMLGRIYILKRGIELVDGKFEVGIDPQTGEVTLGDECLTPDYCRFVAEEDVVIGQEPRWMDKQFIRAEAERIWDGGTKYPLSFDKTVVNKTQDLYAEIAEMLMNGNV